MQITRMLSLKILRYLLDNPNFYFPFKIICKDFYEDDELYEIEVFEDYYNEILENESLITFVLEENIQHLYLQTVELMSKGFIEKILNENLKKKIATLAEEYRENWKEDLWESCDIEEFGLNEYIGGKADAYEDCLRILKENG